MVEPMMYLVLGFLSAFLLALVFAPLVHSRAVKLTRKRMLAAMPRSVTEVQAAKDQQRAAFALELRKVELALEAARSDQASRQAEIGRALGVAARAKAEREDMHAAMLRAQAAQAQAEERLRAAEARLNDTSGGLATTTKELTDKAGEVSALRTEAAGLRTDLEAGRLALAEKAVMIERFEAERGALAQQVATLTGEIEGLKAGEAAENAALRTRLDELAAEIVRLTATLEGSGSPVHALLAEAPGDAGDASLASRIRALQARAAAPAN